MKNDWNVTDTGFLNSNNSRLYQRARLIDDAHNKEGRRNKVTVKGEGWKEKKEREGRKKEAGRSCFGGLCSHLSPIMMMGEGPLQYPTPQ